MGARRQAALKPALRGEAVGAPKNRRIWVETATAMVSEGINLGEARFQDLIERSGASKNSFYANFPGKLPELHAEVIDWWKAQRIPAALDIAVNAVQNPLEKLRILRSVMAGNAIRDEAMRRWATTDPEVAAAVAEADHAIAAYALGALSNLGYQGTEAEDLAEVVVAILQTIRPRAYETLIGRLDPASPRQPALNQGPVAIASGSGHGEVLLFPLPDNLDPVALSQLRARARKLVESLSAKNESAASHETVA
jgi:AcrR family transcriptional regulator